MRVRSLYYDVFQTRCVMVGQQVKQAFRLATPVIREASARQQRALRSRRAGPKLLGVTPQTLMREILVAPYRPTHLYCN
jgi:hypothetical protein